MLLILDDRLRVAEVVNFQKRLPGYIDPAHPNERIDAKSAAAAFFARLYAFIASYISVPTVDQ